MAAIRQEKWAVFYLAMTVSLLLLVKVLLFHDCYSFDTNDDVNHTFVNLKAAQDTLRHGAIPNINLYNNFGTPLLGDALTYPFSAQSITYWLLPGYQAMTVNRAVIGFLTIIVLFAFLRQFLSRPSALLCTLVVFFSPGQFWNFAHHHYQMSLLCFCAILYLQTRSHSLGRLAYLLLLWGAYSVFFLSVSIQLVLLAIPFLVLFLPLKDGSRTANAATINLVALFAAAVATWPHTAAFFANIAGSTRAQWSPYSGILSTLREQLLALVLPPGEWMHYGINGHFSIVTYFSIAYLVFAAIGILSLARKIQSDAPLLRLIVLLGVVPAVAGFMLQFYGDKIPFIRSVDSTRIWWFSNVFLVLALGRLLDSSWKQTFSGFSRGLIAVSAIALAYAYIRLPELIPEFSEMTLIYRIVAIGTIGTLIVISFASHGNRIQGMKMNAGSGATGDPAFPLGKGLVVIVLLLAQLPTLVHILGLNQRSCDKGNHYFSYAQEATFQPQAILKTMRPGYRMASEENPVEGHDLKAIFGGVLGSNARAIVSSRALMDILNRNGLVKLDDNYFFSTPWQTEKLSRLGIRYLLLKQPNGELEAQKWNVTASAEHLGQRFFLYENPSKASLVHLLRDGKPIFLDSYELVPNGIRIALPKVEYGDDLIVSFSYKGVWQAWVDGAEVMPTQNDLGMLQIPIKPQARTVLLQFQGRTGWDFAGYFLLSIAILLIAYVFFYLRYERQSHAPK